jgi:endonuclease YncB( thermonuclease family)
MIELRQSARTATTTKAAGPNIASYLTVLLSAAALMASASLFASPARAEGCDTSGATEVEIAKVTDEFDIVLKDERSIRLAGVKVIGAGAEQQPDVKLAAYVKDTQGSGPASLRLLAPISDRWGRLAGDVFVGGRNLQVSLAERGLAVARPNDLRSACRDAIKAAEGRARRDNAGFWASPDAILKATDGVKLVERDGSFILASGEVRHVSRRKGTSYVDFGAPGSNALFLTIDNRALTRMEKLGFKLEQLSGRKILVRGVVLNGRSPHMGIDDLEAIEFWD